MKKVLLTCAAAGLLVGSTVASAAAIAPAPMFHPWYVGVGLKWNAALTVKTDYPSTSQNNDAKLKNKLGWDIFGGYMVSPKFGTELGFVDYGKSKYTTTNQAGVDVSKIESDGWLVYFDGMYYVPVCNHFKVFAKGGVDYISHKDKNYNWTAATSTWTDVGPTNKLGVVSGNLGAGAQFDYNQFSARFTYTNYEEFLNRFQNDTYYVPNLLNLDVLYHFG